MFITSKSIHLTMKCGPQRKYGPQLSRIISNVRARPLFQPVRESGLFNDSMIFNDRNSSK